MDAGGAGGGAWRGAVAGAAAVLVAQVFVLVINQHWFGIGGPSDNLHDGLNDLLEVLFLLALLPAAMVLAGQLVGRALQLRRWFAVGLLGPLLSFCAVSALEPRSVLQQVALVLAAYAGLGAFSTSIPARARSPRGG